MPAIPYHVAEAFKEGRIARAGNFESNGCELYSYNMLLVTKLGTLNGLPVYDWKFDVDNPPKISVTTSRHINAALKVLRG